MPVERAQFSTWIVDDVELKVRHRVESNEEDPEIDPNFFDDDFNLAVATGGLRVWDGARCLFDFMVEHSEEYLVPGTRMLELGSGSGMLALGLAKKGAHILATDVACGVADIINPSLLLNSKDRVAEGEFWCLPSFGPALKISGGAIACEGLDWRRPLPASLSSLPADRMPEMIVASEVVWLRELADPYLSCLRTCLTAYPSSYCLMSFPIRGLDEEEGEGVQRRLVEVYCGKNYFLKEAANKGLVVQTLACVPPTEKQSKEGVFGTEIYKVTLMRSECADSTSAGDLHAHESE